MKRCVQCDSKDLKKTAVRQEIQVAEHRFETDIPAFVCSSCNESYVTGPDLNRFELMVAAELGKAGEVSGGILRFMRKALGMKAMELAKLLDVSPETVSRWETGAQSIDRRTMTLVAVMITDKLEGRETTLRSLRTQLEPRTLPRKVTLAFAS